MKLIVAGGTGLIGREFMRLCRSAGDEIFLLTRRPHEVTMPAGITVRSWDGQTPTGWLDLMEKCDAVVNLSGESIGSGRWTPERKAKIRSSRIESGAAIVAAFKAASHKPAVLMQASAVGYYGRSDDRILDESSPAGEDYLARLAVEWESSTQPVEQMGVRRVLIRTGIVLDRKQGALPRMLLPFQLFVGGPLGSGRQWLPWIHLHDQVSAMRFLLQNAEAVGPYNVGAPEPVTNAQFGKTLAAVLKRPYWMPVPGFALKLVLGEMSTLVLDGQRAVPRRLVDAGFTFKYPTLRPALQEILDGGRDEIALP